LAHGQPHHEQPQQPDSPQNEATLGTRAPKPHILHPNEENGSENGDVNRQTIDDEGAGQRARRDEQYPCQPQNGLSTQWMEVQMAKASATEIATKMLEEKGDAIGLSASLSPTPAEISRGVGIKEASSPIDEDENWVIVESAINPVSQLALSNCQHKLRDEQQGAPPLGQTSSGAVAGEPRSRFFNFLVHMMEVALASSPTRCPDPIAQAHRAQHPSLSSKHVGSGGTHPGGTDQRKVGALFTFAGPTLTETVLC
jgi:hypothetical protein